MIPRWTLNVNTIGAWSNTRYRFYHSNHGMHYVTSERFTRCSSVTNSTTRVFSTRERIPSKKNKPKEIIKDQFEFSKQGLLYRTSEMEGMTPIGGSEPITDLSKISCMQVYFDESFAQTLHDITIYIKRKLESTFDIMHQHDLITPEEYTDPTTKKLPLYLQPRSIESLNEGICIFYGSTALNSDRIPDDELELFYGKVLLRMEESGFVHYDHGPLGAENRAHPDDFYFSLKLTPHNKQLIQTFPPHSHYWLIANIQASIGMYKLYDELQIAGNRIPSLRHDIVHRNNGQLRRSRRPVWIPQIVLGHIVNGMEGCKKEERTLRNICHKLDITQFIDHDTFNFYPKGVRMKGYIPQLAHPELRINKKPLHMNWDFTFEHCFNAKHPQLSPEWMQEEWDEGDIWRYSLPEDNNNIFDD